LDSSDGFLTGLDLIERAFFDQEVLKTKYVGLLREAYHDTLNTPFNNHHRNYSRLLSDLTEMRAYDANHARSYARRIKSEGNDFSSGEAIFAEIIVYHSHLPLIGEGYITSLELKPSECDLIVRRADGSTAYLEVFSISPVFKGELGGVTSVLSHTQDALSSVRQKLLHKVRNQKQLVKARENWAVIELNSHAIAGSFTVLASLSGGYKVSIDTSTMRTTSEGFDWSQSVFNVAELKHLRGVIHFDLGNYADRRVLVNPKWQSSATGA
jgi:hypothetical protein